MATPVWECDWRISRTYPLRMPQAFYDLYSCRKSSYSSGWVRSKHLGKKVFMSTALCQMRFVREFIRPTFDVIIEARPKWFTICFSVSAAASMSLLFTVHLKSKQGDYLSGFSTQPLSRSDRLRVPQPPLIMKTLADGSTLYFFFHSFISVIFR